MLPKKFRLRRREAKLLISQKKITRCPLFGWVSAANRLSHPRVAIFSSSALGKDAVTRNLQKRRFSAVLYEWLSGNSQSVDVVILPATTSGKNYQEYRVTLLAHLGKIL